MDILTQLLPPTYTGKTETITKDSRRHRQNKKNKKYHDDNKEDINEEQTYVAIERRSGEDRRHKQINRGRWLNSRTGKDRRKNSAKINVEI